MTREPIDLGALRRLHPVDSGFGLGRGRPIDRHYIEGFLRRHAERVRGRVLEVGESTYTERFGAGRVSRSDVLHVDPGHPGATLAADLTDPRAFPSSAFDCFVCTQTLTYIFDVPGALATIHRFLAPGGALLCTVPGISQMSPYDRDRWGEYWRFTTQSLARLLRDAFPGGEVEVAAFGNVLSAVGFLEGLCTDDLAASELEHHDERYPVIVAGCAVKAGAVPWRAAAAR